MARNWEAGIVIMGRYRLVSLLGQGGMGSVWRAEHVELKNHVAVKLLDPGIAQNEEMIARFLREARAAASLQNRHVIQIFDHGVEDGEAFMVMELLEGETLGERLERKGVLPVEEAVTFMCQVMRAMGKAHDMGIIHRDLKPDNIFITSDDDGEFAKILDFGVAKVGGDLGATNGVKTQTGMMLGTPFYMSPEQAKASKVDARTDVWALAVITYECLTGKRPFSGESFAELVLELCNAPIPIPSTIASVPLGFDEWFVHATQRDVDRRFRSARDMANELVQLVHAPSTGGRAAGAARSGNYTPVPAAQAGTPGQRPRMSLTTGQNAAVGVDHRRAATTSSSTNNGVWYFATAALVVIAGGVGLFALQSESQPTAGGATAEETASESTIEEDTTPEREAPPLEKKDEPDSAQQQPEVEEKPLVADETKKPTSATRSKPAPKPKQPKAKPAPSKKPSDSSLPPTEWEF